MHCSHVTSRLMADHHDADIGMWIFFSHSPLTPPAGTNSDKDNSCCPALDWSSNVHRSDR